MTTVERPGGEGVEREEAVGLGVGGVTEAGDRVVDAGVPADQGDLGVAGQGAAGYSSVTKRRAPRGWRAR